MAEPSPWQVSLPRTRTIKKQIIYQHDRYNFSSYSVSHGNDQPQVLIPHSGPHAAGAVRVKDAPDILEIKITEIPSHRIEYGVNHV